MSRTASGSALLVIISGLSNFYTLRFLRQGAKSKKIRLSAFREPPANPPGV